MLLVGGRKFGELLHMLEHKTSKPEEDVSTWGRGSLGLCTRRSPSADLEVPSLPHT